MSDFTCLMYHSLSDGRWPDGQYLKYTTSRDRLREHLTCLTGEGFILAGLDDYLRRMDSGETLPTRYCLLTFDDGHMSSLEIAEILAENNAGGTFFLTMDYCRHRDDFMGDPEIRELYAQGFHLGTHGKSHRALSEMPVEGIRKELVSSKRWLEDIIQDSVTTMSLPAGMGNTTVTKSAFESGYRLVGDSKEISNRRLSPPGSVHRFCVQAPHDARSVLAMASGSSWYSFKRAARAKLISLPKRLLRTYDRTRG